MAPSETVPRPFQELEELHAEIIVGYARLDPAATCGRVLAHGGAIASFCLECQTFYGLKDSDGAPAGISHGFCDGCIKVARARLRPGSEFAR